MNWPGFASLWHAWFFLLLLPLIIFYFLKLKRPQREISSLALWRSVINDQRVNAPFQTFKRNLLLLLQALLLSLLVLAAMQPFLPSGPDRADYLPVLIDCSASMGALDKPGGRTRLDVAKQRTRKLIDNLLPDQRLRLIAFHSSARTLTEFTNNKRVLHDALEKLQVSDVSSQIHDALRMTQALSRTVPIKSVVVLTDGNLPEKVDFDLPFELNYQKLPPGGANVGVTALGARRSGAGRWDVFARLECSPTNGDSAHVELLQNGRPVADEQVVLEPGGSRRLVFRVDTSRQERLEVRVKPRGFDALSVDNQAYLELPEARLLDVFIPSQLASARHAAGVLEGINLLGDDDAVPGAEFDLVVSDRPADRELDATVSLFIGMIPAELSQLVTIGTGSIAVVDWQRNAALLQHVQLDQIVATDQPESAADIGDGHYEELGFEILAHGRTGPLLLEKREGPRIAFYLLFHTDRSTLPYRVAYPILIANAVQLAMEQAELSQVRAAKTGVLPEQRLQPNRQYRVIGPDGSEATSKTSDFAVLSGIAAERVGQYVIRDGTSEVKRLGVGLLDADETSLKGVEQIQFAELSVAAADASIETDQPLWPTLALLGFGVLVVEWWFYQRRPPGATSQ